MRARTRLLATAVAALLGCVAAEARAEDQSTDEARAA